MARAVAFAVAMVVAGAASANDEWPPRGFFDRPAKAAYSSPSPFGAVPKFGTVPKIDPATGLPVKEAPKPLRPALLPGGGPWAWKITKTEWTPEDERGYEEFVTLIGESDCATVHDCLTSPTANPRFHKQNPGAVKFFADCADLPFILRAYYAWQVGLPFSFSVRLGLHARTAGHTTALTGFQVADRYDIVGPGPDARLGLQAIVAFVSSEHFRTPPNYSGRLLNDHYPVSITRESIRPGTVIFDPDGHIAVVSKVTTDGRVFYIDAHPDNSLTRGLFNREFGRAEPPMGAGFKRWRPQRLEGAVKGRDGLYRGGRVVLTPDAQLKDWSDEQFFGTQKPAPKDWKDAKFIVNDQSVQYHEFVRLRLANPGFRYDPVVETRTMLGQICRDMRQRVDAVQLAVKAGIDKRPQPDRLPQNIFATQGEWETYSTPSRDARLKTAFEELRDEVRRFLELHATGNKILMYEGTDLRSELLAIYQKETQACTITYTRSNGVPQTLTFAEVKERLFRLSFDPYHCVERRWGATAADELAACREDTTKAAWYQAERRLRNQLVRTYGEKMGWTLAELRNPNLDIGIEDEPDVDVVRVLEGMGAVPAAAAVSAGTVAAVPVPAPSGRRTSEVAKAGGATSGVSRSAPKAQLVNDAPKQRRKQ